jgi:hypothetical protein
VRALLDGGANGTRSVAAHLAFALVSTALSFVVGCAASGPTPHKNLAPTWREFSKLPMERAMAIAGDPRQSRWVAGLSAGHADAGDAEAAALRECQRRRHARRLQAECVLYAVGDEIVWRSP